MKKEGAMTFLLSRFFQNIQDLNAEDTSVNLVAGNTSIMSSSGGDDDGAGFLGSSFASDFPHVMVALFKIAALGLSSMVRFATFASVAAVGARDVRCCCCELSIPSSLPRTAEIGRLLVPGVLFTLLSALLFFQGIREPFHRGKSTWWSLYDVVGLFFLVGLLRFSPVSVTWWNKKSTAIFAHFWTIWGSCFELPRG